MIFLGIDCGTQSTKTIALDVESGAVIASAQKAYGFTPNTAPGAMEQDPADWIDAADETIRTVLAQVDRSRVGGIGVSGQQHGLVVLDKDNTVVRPAKLWCDTSTIAQCEAITRHFGGGKEVIARVGNAMLPGYTAPKILWLRENEPENWARTRTVLLPHDYLNFWLTGVARMEFGDASGMALMDPTTRTWNAEMVTHVAPDLADKLPPLGSSAQPHGQIQPSLAARWGIGKDVVVSAGGGDNMMGAIGTGNIRPGVVTASLGTSGTLYAFSDKPAIDPAGEVAGFCDSTDHWLPLVCTMNVTLVTEMIRRNRGWDYAELEENLTSVPPGCDGLLLLPYFSGERTPNLPGAKGVYFGITTENFTPAHTARAAVEGVTLGLGYGLTRFRELGVHPTEIRLTGGGSNSPAWRQICADIFGVPTICLRSTEGAALGAAIQAAWMTLSEPLGTLCERLIATDPATRSEPNPDAVSALIATRSTCDKLRSALTDAGLFA